MEMILKVFGSASLVLSLAFYFLVGKGLQRAGHGWADDALPTALLVVGVSCFILAWKWAGIEAAYTKRAERRAVKRQILDEEVERRLKNK